MPNFNYENSYIKKGYVNIAGVDEAGRGPLAGPVVAAAVILPHNINYEIIDDSKKLTDKKRRVAFAQILNSALSYGIGIVDNNTIDEINILKATFLAMNRAIQNSPIKPDFALIDGNRNECSTVPVECIVKGDSKSLSIAAASIIAKVTRDDIMLKYDELYPGYGFSKHKGYPTKDHYAAIGQYGVLEIHRKSFRLR